MSFIKNYLNIMYRFNLVVGTLTTVLSLSMVYQEDQTFLAFLVFLVGCLQLSNGIIYKGKLDRIKDEEAANMEEPEGK